MQTVCAIAAVFFLGLTSLPAGGADTVTGQKPICTTRDQSVHEEGFVVIGAIEYAARCPRLRL